MRIDDLSSEEAFEIAEDWLIENAFDDPEFWEAIIQGIKDTWKNRKELLNVLLDLIGYGHGEELDKYIRNVIYDYDLLAKRK